MTRKATIAERTRVCPVCKGEFVVDKPSRKQPFRMMLALLQSSMGVSMPIEPDWEQY